MTERAALERRGIGIVEDNECWRSGREHSPVEAGGKRSTIIAPVSLEGIRTAAAGGAGLKMWHRCRKLWCSSRVGNGAELNKSPMIWREDKVACSSLEFAVSVSRRWGGFVTPSRSCPSPGGTCRL